MACQFCTMPGGKHDDECPYDNKRLKAEVAKATKQIEDGDFELVEDFDD